MGTVADLIESARYDLADYQEGLDFDDRILFNYLNRMIVTMDSQLAALGSDLAWATETDIDTVSSQDYVDLTYMNNGYWDSVFQVWIGQDMKYKMDIQDMYVKRKWYSSDAEPNWWTQLGRQLLWETTADAAHTDLVIHYYKKHRKRLESWSDTFTANATTDAITLASGRATFVTGDGPFTVSNSGGALPGGLSASTNYWVRFDPTDTDALQLCTSKVNALEDSVIDITTTGSGTHTITLGNDEMPWDGIFDEFLREMLVLHALSKSTGNLEATNANLFKKRAMEEVIRRGFVPKYYHITF